SKKEISVVLIMATMLTGCAIDCTKPDTGGLIGGIVCLSNDGYAKEQVKRDEGVKDAKIEHEQVTLEGVALTAEMDKLTTQFDQLSNKIELLSQNITQLKTETTAANDTKAQLLLDMKKVNKRLRIIKKKIAASQKKETLQQVKLKKYQAQAAELETAVEELIDLYDTIA
ncbi:MAG: hypothetical protein KAH77_09675, partial [Thiomargarita sp.]|nr:hypothetical protein [Thiomargarita sp.]